MRDQEFDTAMAFREADRAMDAVVGAEQAAMHMQRDFAERERELLAEIDRLQAAARQFCRECRDENEYGTPAVPADFILWGKLFPPEALGPRCYSHAVKHIGERNMSQLGQWAVFDLRPFRAALDEEKR